MTWGRVSKIRRASVLKTTSDAYKNIAAELKNYGFVLRLVTTIVCFSLLSISVQAQGQETVQLRIEPVGAHATYDKDGLFPIRCRFKNISDQPVEVTLPGLGSRQATLAGPHGLEVSMRREDKKTPPVCVQSEFRLDFCRKLSEKMNSDVTCDSPGDTINLQPNEELVRTIHLSTAFGREGTLAERVQPGKYWVQITSRQADATLLSNEIMIDVRGATPSRPNAEK
jgi:hypothetical protein